jgi:hypothetical protein
MFLKVVKVLQQNLFATGPMKKVSMLLISQMIAAGVLAFGLGY